MIDQVLTYVQRPKTHLFSSRPSDGTLTRYSITSTFEFVNEGVMDIPSSCQFTLRHLARSFCQLIAQAIRPNLLVYISRHLVKIWGFGEQPVQGHVACSSVSPPTASPRCAPRISLGTFTHSPGAPLVAIYMRSIRTHPLLRQRQSPIFASPRTRI